MKSRSSMFATTAAASPPSTKTLRGFARVPLVPGEKRTVSFTLTPEHLALFGAFERWMVEPGRFTVMIGASSEDIRATGTSTITDPDGAVPKEATITGDSVDPIRARLPSPPAFAPPLIGAARSDPLRK